MTADLGNIFICLRYFVSPVSGSDQIRQIGNLLQTGIRDRLIQPCLGALRTVDLTLDRICCNDRPVFIRITVFV